MSDTTSPRRVPALQPFTIAHDPDSDRTIECVRYGPPNASEAASLEPPTLIFTHGAGGDVHSAAMVNFSRGFAESGSQVQDDVGSSVVCFSGSMNLKSRVSNFQSILRHYYSSSSKTKSANVPCLGGRSMGARAAVIASGSPPSGIAIKHLILVSYPLHTTKKSGEEDVRDAILIDLPSNVNVLFISGDRDEMCDLSRLQAVRERMKACTWLVTVKGADHGTNVIPKKGTESVGIGTGRVASDWLEAQISGGGDTGNTSTECEIWWDSDRMMAIRGDWKANKTSSKNTKAPQRRTAVASPSRDVKPSEQNSSKGQAKKPKNLTSRPKPETKGTRKSTRISSRLAHTTAVDSENDELSPQAKRQKQRKT